MPMDNQTQREALACVRSVINGVGHYLPENIVTNKDLETKLDTTHEWILKRTGISQRHIADPDMPTSALAVFAAQNALESSSLEARDIDAVIVATTTPDRTFPSTAAVVQSKVGTSKTGFAFDVQAVCSGFVYALSVANAMIVSRQVRNVLVIGAEKMSSILDWNDRTTCVLFGDGAGAVILSATTGQKGDLSDRGIFSTHLHSDGDHRDLLYTDGGPSTTGQAGVIKMEGREVFRHAVQCLSDVVEETLAANGISPDDIAYLVPHQANLRIIEGTAKKLSMDMNRVIVTVGQHGNTSAASVPLALSVAINDGRIKQGDLLLLEAMGGGLTWGSALVRF